MNLHDFSSKEMDMINIVSETQKTHLEEIKEYIGKCLGEISVLTEDRDKWKELYDEAAKNNIELVSERDAIKEKLKESTESYLKEFNDAKHHWEGVEEHLRLTIESIQSQLQNFDSHNQILNEKTIFLEKELDEKIENMEKLKFENEKLKKESIKFKEENEKMKNDFEIVSDELHEVKMKTIKEINEKENLQNEIKRHRKATESVILKLNFLNEQKSSLIKTNEDLTKIVLKNKEVEGEIKDVKFYMNILGRGNGTINSKLEAILQRLKKDKKDVALQTDMTYKEIDEFDNLDRQATILVMKMREEMINAKDEMLNLKDENETLRRFVNDVKRERETKEEEERVKKLEAAVKNLGEIVLEPSKEDLIIQKLAELKKDLENIKKTKIDPNPDLNVAPVKLTSFRNRKNLL